MSERQPTPRAAKPRPTISLRAKGVWMLIGFVVFTIIAGIIINLEREALYAAVQQLEIVHVEEEYQVALNLSVARAILVVNDNAYSNDLETAARNIAIEIDTVITGLDRAARNHAPLAGDIAALRATSETLSGSPSRAVLTEARAQLHKLVVDMDDMTVNIRSRKRELLARYRNTFDKLSLEWTLTAALGVLFLGSMVMLFVTRLSWDIQRVQDRALAIVDGYRDEPLAVTRHDELGALMAAVNNMQHELRRREMQIEVGRQQRFHHEKMAAVGSLAAAVAHEINNPLSAIVGAAQVMSDMRNSNSCQDPLAMCHPEMLMEQARRVMAITRQISEFSRPQSAAPELLDLNNLIRSTARFVGFDRRFSTIELALDLDLQLPAVYAVGDHVTQVMMNLLINAADAQEGQVGRKPHITLATRYELGRIIIKVADNGIGMDAATLAQVFQEYFTTKPPGKGSGIGLAVSRSLIEMNGGDISIASEPNVGTTVTVQLPLEADPWQNDKKVA